MARLARTTSDFGAQLDSLCDMVSFGVAPGFLLVKMCPTFTYSHNKVWIIAASFAACAALRLARFNVEMAEDDDHMHFSGLPSPAAAASIAGFAILFYELRRDGNNLLYAAEIDKIVQTALPFFALLVALLMVSRIPYPHVVNQVLRGQRSFGHVVALLFAAVAIMSIHGYSVPIIGCAFVLYAPLKYALAARPCTGAKRKTRSFDSPRRDSCSPAWSNIWPAFGKSARMPPGKRLVVVLAANQPRRGDGRQHRRQRLLPDRGRTRAGLLELRRRPRDARPHESGRAVRGPSRSIWSRRCGSAIAWAGILSPVTSKASARLSRETMIATGRLSGSVFRSALGRYMVEKGSIAVDGVSLTLVDVEAERFSVALIPHTLGSHDAGPARRRRPRQSGDRPAGQICPEASCRTLLNALSRSTRL